MTNLAPYSIDNERHPKLPCPPQVTQAIS